MNLGASKFRLLVPLGSSKGAESGQYVIAHVQDNVRRIFDSAQTELVQQ